MRGFTLVEVLVATSIIVIGLVAALSLISFTVGYHPSDVQKLTAVNLAQEGIELIRNKRDNNWAATPIAAFDAGISGTGNFQRCIVDYKGAFSCYSDGTSKTISTCYNASPSCRLKINSNGFYEHNSGTDVSFYRLISLESVTISGTDHYIKVTSQVLWKERGKDHTVVIVSHLYDWMLGGGGGGGVPAGNCGNNIIEIPEICDGTSNVACDGLACIASGLAGQCTCKSCAAGDTNNGDGTCTGTYYVGTGDGVTAAMQPPVDQWSWNTVLGCGAATITPDDDDAQLRVGHAAIGAIQLWRAFFPINTSAIPATANIVEADFYFYVDSISAAITSVNLVQTTQASVNGIVAGDVCQCGVVYGWGPDGIYTHKRISSTGLINMHLNAAGLTWIKKAGQPSTCGSGIMGWTCLGVRQWHDLESSAWPAGSQDQWIQVRTANWNGFSPYLVIRYAP